MGRRIYEDYSVLRESGVTNPDAAAALMPHLPGPMSAAVGQQFEIEENPIQRVSPDDLDIPVADSIPYFAQRAEDELGLAPHDASVVANEVANAFYTASSALAPSDDVVTRNVVQDLRSGKFNQFAEATAVTSDVPLEVPEAGISIPAMDQQFKHWRDVAAGRFVGKVDDAAVWRTDLEGIGAAFAATWGALQQGWFGYRIGETWSDILQRRLWPTVEITDDEGNTEQKSALSAVMEAGWDRMWAEMMQWSPRMFSADYRKRQAKAVKEARGKISDILETDWYQNVISGREVMEYNLMGYGWDPVRELNQPFSPGTGTLMRLPPLGTPEREQVDAAVHAGMAENYAQLRDTTGGKALMGGMAIMGAGIDMLEDPLLFAGELAPGLVNAGRKALAASSRARVTGAVARHTGSIDDTLRALDDATSWVEAAKKKLASNNTEDAQKQLAQANDNLVRLQAQYETFRQGAAEAMLVTDLPQANPALVARIGRTYLEANPEHAAEATETLLRNLQREADARVSIVERRLKSLQEGDDPQFFQQQLDLSKKEQAAIRETTEWFMSKAERPEQARLSQAFEEAIALDKPYQPESIVFPDERDMVLAFDQPEVVSHEILRNIRRGVAAKAPEEELMQWEVTYRMLQDGTLTPRQAMNRVTGLSGDDLIKLDIRSSRLSAQKNLPHTLDEVTLEDAPATIWNRATAGPDAGEQAGNAAMRLSGGGDMDDVYIRSMTVDTYLNSFGQRPRSLLGMDDAPNVYLGDEAFKTNVEAAEWQQSLWEKASDVFAKGLYPKSFHLRPMALLSHFREVAWALESVNPRLMRRVENALRAQEFEMQRMLGLFNAEFKALGLVDEAGKINEELAQHYGRILNYTPDSREYMQALADMQPYELRSMRRIREAFDFLADKQGLRNTDRRLTGYITHALDDADFPAGTLDPVWQGIPADEAIFQPWLEWRNVDPEHLAIDLVTATDRYLRAATKKIHIEPLLKDLRLAGARAGAVDPKLAWFSTYTNHLIDVLKGRPSVLGSFVDNAVANQGAWRRGAQLLDEMADEPVAGVADEIRPLPKDQAPISTRTREKVHGAVYGASTLAYMGALTGNRRYFPMAVATGLATSGARYGMWRTAEGIVSLARPEVRRLAEAAGVRNHLSHLLDPLTDADAAKTIQRLSERLSSMHLGTPSLQFSENVIRGWSFHAALSELMTRTGFRTVEDVQRAGLLNSYLSEAAFATQNINHRFGMLGRPPMLRRLTESGTTAATQFLTFPYKQLETLAWMTRENPGYIARYMAFSGAISRLGSSMGVDLGQYVSIPGVSDFDTKSIMTETLGSWVNLASETSRVLNREGDPQDLMVAARRVGEQATNLIPLANAMESWYRDISRLQTGEERRPGELVRKLDLGQFEWDEDASVAENLANIPLGFVGEDGGSTDMASILTGLRSTHANIEKAQFDGAMQEIKREAFYRRRIADEFEYALETGDKSEFRRVLQDAQSRGVMPPDLDRLTDRVVMSHALPRLVRLQADKMLATVETLQQMRAQQRR